MDTTKEIYTPETFSKLLKILITTPEQFTTTHLKSAFHHLASSTSNGNGCTDSQIGSFLTGLKLNKLDINSNFLASAAEVLRNYSIKIDLTDEEAGERKERGPICDIVGTGGDGHNTFNVSTTAGIVASGAGCRVFKHGNKAATSSSGSADILLSLGCPITTIPPSSISSISTQSPFLFLYAPSYHPTMARLAPIRKSLGFSTIFNLLGPLINPAKPQVMIVGVHSFELGRLFAEAVRILGVENAWVVCGKEGLDEISPEGETWVWEVKNGGPVTEKVISPSTFGLASHSLSSVVGGTPSQNSETLKKLLNNDLELDTNNSIENFVIMNSAALLFVAGIAKSEIEGVRLARESIKSGRAAEALENFRIASNKFAVV